MTIMQYNTIFPLTTAIISEYICGTSLDANRILNRIAIKSKENVLKEGPQVVSDFASIFLMAASFLVVITESFGKSYQDPFSDFQEEAPLNIGNKPADLLEQTKEYCIMP